MRIRGKVAITVAPELLAAVERIRKRTGESRSAVFERALAAYLAQGERAEESRRYVAGYRRQPERSAEQGAAMMASLTALAAEPWDAKR
jgi:metal-responsive CopG/Arc/MetJ family transcriptional regulator